MPEATLVIACGAVAREIMALKRRYGWNHLHLKCIDARLHNRPGEIPGRVRKLIAENRTAFPRIFVAYADCGTAGALDEVLEETGVQRLPGAHCYQFLAGHRRFDELSRDNPGTFYVTDFLVRHFERFVIEPLGLDRHPELRDAYFGNYSRLVYLSQSGDATLVAAARLAAERLSLPFEHVHCGYGELETELYRRLDRWGGDQDDLRVLA
ncbi:MAG: DUF1638 domain-containing protein [Woeseiaceae bacterium]